MNSTQWYRMVYYTELILLILVNYLLEIEIENESKTFDLRINTQTMMNVVEINFKAQNS